VVVLEHVRRAGRVFAEPGGQGARQLTASFRDGPKDQTRNLEIPGSPLRAAPE
jgi:hypothetical protein